MGSLFLSFRNPYGSQAQTVEITFLGVFIYLKRLVSVYMRFPLPPGSAFIVFNIVGFSTFLSQNILCPYKAAASPSAMGRVPLPTRSSLTFSTCFVLYLDWSRRDGTVPSTRPPPQEIPHSGPWQKGERVPERRRPLHVWSRSLGGRRVCSRGYMQVSLRLGLTHPSEIRKSRDCSFQLERDFPLLWAAQSHS